MSALQTQTALVWVSLETHNLNMNTVFCPVGWPAQQLCLDVTPHFCPCTLRIKWSEQEENSPRLWAQESSHFAKHIKQHILRRATKLIAPHSIMEFKSWRCTKLNWIQSQEIWSDVWSQPCSVDWRCLKPSKLSGFMVAVASSLLQPQYQTWPTPRRAQKDRFCLHNFHSLSALDL